MIDIVKSRGYMDRGLSYERISENRKHKYNQSEEAFIKEWKRESRMLRPMFSSKKVSITVKDRFVAATIIQWLGSNCGLAFLRSALNKCGYDMIPRDFEKERVDKKRKEDLRKISKSFGL